MIESDNINLIPSPKHQPLSPPNNTLSKTSSSKRRNLLQFNSTQLKHAPPKKRDDPSEKKIIFGGRFEITPSRLLGKGSFGEIYIAQDIEDHYNYCAIKLENRTKNYFLKVEKSVLEVTSDLEGFPKLIMFNSQGENNFLAMELLGPNLTDLFEICKQRFTLQTTLLLGIQMLSRVQDLHSKNYIHRDIKPENFLIGKGDKSNLVYLIDFGLSKKYKDAKMDHLPYREHRPLTGTTRYASINNHLGIEQSRRDDLESIGYVMLYFIKKRLPWQGCQGSTKQAKYNKILEKKLMIPLDLLCKDLPMEFQVYLKYVKKLRFDERPNYEFLKGLFIDLLFSLYKEQFIYDWTMRYPDDASNIRDDIIKSKKTKSGKRKDNRKSIGDGKDSEEGKYDYDYYDSGDEEEEEEEEDDEEENEDDGEHSKEDSEIIEQDSDDKTIPE